MKTISAKIDRESETALKALVNNSTGLLFSPHADIHYGSSVIAVKHVSIPLDDDRFVVIECDWDETPEGYDYYHLSARLADSPKDIENQRRAWKYLSLCFGAFQTAAAVEVLEAHFVFAEEAVRFDAGIRITLQDGIQIAIVCQESIAGLLEFAAMPEDNESLTDDLQTRLIYGCLPSKTP